MPFLPPLLCTPDFTDEDRRPRRGQATCLMSYSKTLSYTENWSRFSQLLLSLIWLLIIVLSFYNTYWVLPILGKKVLVPLTYHQTISINWAASGCTECMVACWSKNASVLPARKRIWEGLLGSIVRGKLTHGTISCVTYRQFRCGGCRCNIMVWKSQTCRWLEVG